jgi:hypothetical protein
MKEIIFMIVSILIFSGCSVSHTNNNLHDRETVMPAGMSITAETQNGLLIITANTGFKRTYSWAGNSRSAVLWPREERWNGSFGIYYPGPDNHWKEHDGITRAILEEGQLNFNSLNDLNKYLSSYEEIENLVFNDSGLCIFWSKNPGAGGTMTVHVWQLLINNEKPQRIPGSNNNKIKIIAGNST